MTQHEQLLKEYLDSLEISKYGFGNLKNELPSEYSIMNTGISFAVRLSDYIIDEINTEPTYTYFHHYRTVNFFIDQISLKIALKIQELGFLAMPIPASQSVNKKDFYYQGIFQHRTAATRAGIGWIGKNGSLITNEFGPRVRLGTILTNMPLTYSKPINNSLCGKCKICVEACPALALKGNKWSMHMTRSDLLDPKACSKFMSTQFHHIGRGVVCGICLKVCPIGSERIKSRENI